MALDFAKKATQQEENPAYRAVTNVRQTKIMRVGRQCRECYIYREIFAS
jgi:hypothetical protein